MSDFRLIFDDTGQSETQKNLLREFANTLSDKLACEVLWSSNLENDNVHQELSVESARRLNVRLLALQFLPGIQTIFFPGHFYPVSELLPEAISASLAANRFAGIPSLDFFIVNNGANEIRDFNLFMQESPDYEKICNYAGLSVEMLPAWAGNSHGISCIRLSDRPWYSASCEIRQGWIEKINNLLTRNVISLDVIVDDINNGLIRPSVLDELAYLKEEKALPNPAVYTLDDLFIYPEIRLVESQYNLLHSKELQNRIENFSRKRVNKKMKFSKSKEKSKSKIPGLHRLPSPGVIATWLMNILSSNYARIKKILFKQIKSLRRAIRKFPYYLYKLYAISLRPVVKLFFDK